MTDIIAAGMVLERFLWIAALFLAAACSFLFFAGMEGQELAAPSARVLTESNGDLARRGIYLTSFALAKLDREAGLEGLLARMVEVGLNTVVVNVKNMHGQVTYETDLPLAQEVGAVDARLDLSHLLPLFKSRGIYTVARQVVFYDPNWAEYSGSSLTPWVSPSDFRVVQYNLALAREVLSLGFDELQFDYVRFPDDGELGGSYDMRYRAIEEFLKLAREQLDGRISIDVFGRTLWEWNRRKIDPIGQHLEELVPYVDSITPMVYPSHFERGLCQKPYEAVKRSLNNGLERGLPLRPFLQAFKLHIPAGMSYYDYIGAQIRAAEELGIKSYLFWNPRSDYDELLLALKEHP